MEIQFNKPYIFQAPKDINEPSEILVITKKPNIKYLSYFLNHCTSYDDIEYWTLGTIEVTNIIYILGLNSSSYPRTNFTYKNGFGNTGVAHRKIFEKMIEVGYLRLLDSHEEIGHEYGLI